MAEQVEVVIKIPVETYEYWKEHSHEYVLAEAIKNGTPLPKGHGDLIDRDAVNSRYDGIYAELDSLSNKPTYKELLDKLSMCLDTAMPILEADEESEET